MAETHSQTSQTETQQGTKRDHDSFSELEKLETPFTADSQFVRGFETQAMEGVEVRSQEHHTVEDSDNVLQSNHPRPAVNVEESGKVKEASNQPTAPAEELIYGKPVATKLDTECQSQSSIPTPSVDCKTEGNPLQPSSRRSSSASLTDVASATPSLRGSPPPSTATPAPSAFAALDGNGPPPKKQRIREKLTFAEKEAKRIEKEFLEQERAAEKARKDAERESKRKKIELEREEKRIALEAAKEERRRIEMEREEKRVALEAAKEERRRKKEEEKKAKEEEKQRAEEEKRKKERSQKTLGSFFAIPAPTVRQKSIEGRSSMSPAPTNTPLAAPTTSPGASSPTKKQVSAYDKLFPAFFVQQNVTVAPINRFERDEEASEALQNIIDSYLLEGQSSEYHLSFNAVDLFHLSGITNIPRGRRLMTVRDIMTEFSGNPSRPIDLTSDSQNTQIKKTVDLLRRIPMKSLKFQQDVRPAYIGTFTTQPLHGLQRLARNPLRKDHPTTDYDYDSEAEWVEDEDAEDLESDGEEEDVEMVDAGEDLEGFLDDEGDETALARRHPLQATAEEPVSSGLCWEDNHKRNTNVKMMPYRMEFILDKMKSIDPFSSEYWDPPKLKSLPNGMEPPRIPLANLKISNKTITPPPGVKPIKSLFPYANTTNGSQPLLFPPSQGSSQTQANPPATRRAAGPKKSLPSEDMPAFRDAVRGNELSKVGLIEVLKKRFPGRTAGQIKTTLESCARRIGVKEADKRWMLVDEVEVPVVTR